MGDMRICQKDDEGISNCRQGEYRFTNKSNRMYEIAIFITETRSITMSAFKIHLYGEDSHSVYNVLLLKYEKGILSLLGEVSRI